MGSGALLSADSVTDGRVGPATIDAGRQRGHDNDGRGAADNAPRARGREEVGRPARREVREGWRDSEQCRAVVQHYYTEHGLPPGLAKKGSLPPGLQKQVRERGALPPGLRSHLVPLPVVLERDLPPLPPHYVRRFLGSDLLVIDLRMSLVVSIIPGVLVVR